MGVFDIADFKFWVADMRFERNERKRFSNFQNQISGPKTENQNRISSFDVRIFQFWGVDFEFLSPKLKIEIEFQLSVSKIFVFPKPNFSIKPKFQILAESNSAFSSDFDPKVSIFRVYIQIFPRILLSTRNICSPNFSSTSSCRR